MLLPNLNLLAQNKVQKQLPADWNYEPEVEDELFDSIVTAAAIQWFQDMFGLESFLATEEILNRKGTSLYKLIKEPQYLSRKLEDIFGENATRLLLKMFIGSAAKACKVPYILDEPSHINLENALNSIRALAMHN